MMGAMATPLPSQIWRSDGTTSLRLGGGYKRSVFAAVDADPQRFREPDMAQVGRFLDCRKRVERVEVQQVGIRTAKRVYIDITYIE